MFSDTAKLIRQAISGLAAKNDVSFLAGFHRIQASPGYHAAASYIQETLQAVGITAHIEQFPADEISHFWAYPSFQEWSVSAATLDLIDPAKDGCRLADFRELQISLIQRSAPFVGNVEIVLLEDGLDEKEYLGLDVEGKVVLTKGSVDRVAELAIDKHGAVGIIYFGISGLAGARDFWDLPDARQYTSFWWTGGTEQKKAFGFVLSPRQGQWLAKLIKEQESKGESPVRAKVKVDSQLYDGSLEVVSAIIPGESNMEAIIVSHLCHPQPSANDNASGAAAALEAARTLKHLIDQGKLSPPKRSIRFLWVPEFYGTVAYLATHEKEIPQMIAGLNLDMVGGNLAENGATLILECPPDASSSFVPALLDFLCERLYDHTVSHTGMGTIPKFAYTTEGFSGGSDHTVFSDPAVGVPMSMMIQMPDLFYHTSADTVDHIDPVMMAQAARLAAGFAYFISSADRNQAIWLAHQMATRFEKNIGRKVQEKIDQSWQAQSLDPYDQVERLVSYHLDRYKSGLETLNQFSNDLKPILRNLHQQGVEFGEHLLARARAAAEFCPVVDFLPPDNSSSNWVKTAETMIPKRLFRGPAPLIPNNRLHRLSPEQLHDWSQLVDSRKQGGHTIPILADYWANGERSALEIIDLVEMETGIRDPELVIGRFRALYQVGLIEFINQ